MTGGYVVAMMVGPTVSSAAAVPLAVLLGGWSLSLAVWAVPAALAVAAWLPIGGASRARPGPRRAGRRCRGATRSPGWRAATRPARRLLVYGWMTWLPPYYQSQGFSPALAGLLLAGVERGPDPGRAARPGAGGTAAAVAVLGRPSCWPASPAGTLGALLMPLPPLVGPWLWVVLIGIGSGPASRSGSP